MWNVAGLGVGLKNVYPELAQNDTLNDARFVVWPPALNNLSKTKLIGCSLSQGLKFHITSVAHR